MLANNSHEILSLMCKFRKVAFVQQNLKMVHAQYDFIQK